MELEEGNIEMEAIEISLQLQPDKSRHRYEKEYSDFCKWFRENKGRTVTDNILLLYISRLSKNIKPTSLWANTQ